MRTILTGYDAMHGNEFEVHVHAPGKRRKTLKLTRIEAIEVTQQWLEGLKATKSSYNKAVKMGDI
jgi:hypothetical protein